MHHDDSSGVPDAVEKLPSQRYKFGFVVWQPAYNFSQTSLHVDQKNMPGQGRATSP